MRQGRLDEATKCDRSRKDASESATLGVVDSLIALAEAITECRRCERLVEWREKLAQEKRAASAEEQ